MSKKLAKKDLRESTKLEGFEALFKSLEKDFGEDAGRPITERKAQNVERFSSGLLTLDDIIGGGIPKGRIIEIFGPESSGKTSICLKMIAAAQQQGITAAFIDAEHTLDPLWAEQLGVDMTKMLFDQPMSGEKALNLVQALVESGKIGLIVVDSVAALTPLAEASGEIGEAHIGRLARLMSQAMRILVPLAARNKVTLVFTNQIRMNIGVMFGNPEVTTGGNALKFFASLRLNVSRKKYTEGDVRSGDAITFRAIKSKISAPFQTGEVLLRYGEGFDLLDELYNLSLKYELITKSGSWYYYEGENIGQGEEQVKDWLKEHTELHELLLQKLNPPLTNEE